jgi:hypothetical protein
MEARGETEDIRWAASQYDEQLQPIRVPSGGPYFTRSDGLHGALSEL